MKLRTKQVLFTGAGLAGILLAAPAMAQTATATSAQPPAALDEVIVTARKTAETLIDVPLAVTAMSAEQMAARGITDVEDLQAFTPGLRFQNQSVGRNDRGFKQYVIRGMVPNSALATRQAVTLFVDGAPVAGGNISGVTDVERVEVVKGPQSAFFGRSTFAGAMNFITRAPGFDWRAAASVDYARFDAMDVNASLEGPLAGDVLAFRLSGRYYNTDGGYANYGFPGERLGARETKSVALTLFAQPTDNLSARLFVTGWNDSDGPAANGQFNSTAHNCFPGAANYVCGGLGFPPAQTVTHNPTIEPVAFAALTSGKTLHGGDFIDHMGLERDAYQARMIVDYEFDAGYTLSAIAARGKNKWAFLQNTPLKDTRNIPNPNFGRVPGVLPHWNSLVLGNTQDKDTSLELRLSSPQEQRLRWLFGVNYNKARTDNLTAVFGNSGYLLPTPQTVNSSKTLGIFGSVALDVTDQVTVTVEGRKQRDKLFQTTLAGTRPEFEDTFNSFTPRAILEFKPNEDVTLYASYAEGTRPGEFNTIYFAQTPAVQAEIDKQANVQGAVPEDVVEMYELGLKGEFLDRRLRVLAALYKGEWTNRHIPNYVYWIDEFNQQRSIQVTAANGVVDLQGFELELAYRPVAALTLEGTFNISDTEIKRTFCTDCQLLTGNPSPVGTQLPYYPKYSGSLSGTYQVMLPGGYDGFVRADYLYTGKQYAEEANLAWSKPAHYINLRAGVHVENYKLEVYGNNLLDDDSPTSLARTTEPVTNAQSVTVSLPEPRTFGVRVSAQF